MGRTSSLRIKTSPEYKDFEIYCDKYNIKPDKLLKFALRNIVRFGKDGNNEINGVCYNRR